MKRSFLFLVLFVHAALLFAQDSIAYRIVLIGDAGELTNGLHPVARAVKKNIPMDARTTIVYLGDNLYSTGLPDIEDITYQQAKAVLDSQLSIADGTPAKIYMIPGNHDWQNGGRNGYDAVIREQIYVDILNRNNVKFYPEGGCPGPEEKSLGPDVVLVMFDSQWWLHPYDKPGIESDCDYKTKEEVLTQLDDIFSRNSRKLIILACHHTFKSSSPHGGYYTWKQHIFPFTDVIPKLYIPLPIIGSIYPITRGIFGTPQDLKHPNYVNMISDIQNVTSKYKNIVFVGGHDHSLQLIRDSSYYYITSGAGSKTNRVYKSKRSVYAADTTGFAVLEVSKSKIAKVSFYTVTDTTTRLAFSDNIIDFSKFLQGEADSIEHKVVEDPFVKYKDTITLTASDRFETNSSFKKFFMGTNYRKEWSTPVNMRVFNIRKEKGGLKIQSLGGGKQTKSLRLTDPTGREWVLRTIDKDPSRAIPEAFRPTIAGKIVRDLISSSHPYSPMTIPVLSEALDLTVAKPELFFVPEDPAFGLYKDVFKNTICFLEERNPTRYGVEETKSTIKVFDDLLKENDHRADQPAVLRARLLDMLIADFDRHFDQWRWAKGDTGKGKLYYPIPKDRDQAFFYSNGLLMKWVSMKVMPFLKGLRYNIPDVKGLNEVARDFDRVFLTDLDEKEWKTIVADVQQKLSDSVIHRALKKLPPEIYALDSAVLTDKLISRRAELDKAAMHYYRFISRYVNVVGSNQKEYFKLTSVPGRGLNVRVYGRVNNNDTSFVMYERTFYRKDTREIRLYGLNDNDIFFIDENVNSPIKIRVIGGKGNDTFDIRGHSRNYLYDLDVEGNYIRNRSHSKRMFSSEPFVNYYNILGFKYNQTSFPSFIIAANNDDGLLLGTGFSRKVYGFRNEPWVSYQKFSALWAVNRGGRQYTYTGTFNRVFRGYDLAMAGELMTPGITNFFGLGNNTMIDKTKPISYYQARFRHFEGQLLFQRRLYSALKLLAGPVFYVYWNELKDNNNKVLGNPSLIGLDSVRDVYSTKRYLGGKFVIDVNNLNNELFPTRGVQWITELESMAGLNDKSNTFTKLHSDMTVHASLSDPARIVAVLRFGGGHIFSKHFEYFQALTLGSHNYLRGFRKNRFAGNSVMYGSAELRVKLTDIKSYVLPGSLGLVGFNEIGRVWMKNESSGRWHYAYGGGFYYIPFNLFIVSATIGYSKEEHLFNFSVGTRLNLSF